MKKIIIILTTVSVLLLSCAEKQPESLPFEFDENLQNIDTLLQSDAGDALQKLLSCHSEYEVRGTSLNYNDSYRYLLLSEALYKTDNPQYYRNELQTAMQYFDSITQRYPANDDLTVLSARSHYMNGVGFYENDSVVDSCKEYLHTLEIMEKHFDVEKLRGYKAKFMGLTYNRLAELFSDRFMIELSLYCDKQALLFCKLIPTSKYSVPNILFRIGKKYDMSQQADSAFLYYNLALESLPDSNNVVFRDISTHLYLMSYSMDSETDNHLCDLKRIIELADDKNEMLTRYVAAGYIHYKEECYDSAAYCFGKVFENKTDDVARITSAKYLYDIYLVNGDSMSANKYAAFLADHATYRYDDMIEVSTLDKLFNDYLDGRQNNRHDNNTQHLMKPVVIVGVFALIIILSFIVIRAKRTDKNNDNIKIIIANPFLDEPICKHILEIVDKQEFKSKVDFRIYREFALGKDQLMALRDAVDRHYDNFTQRLSKDYPELTYDDIDYCCLYLLGLKDADISALLQRAYPTVHQRSNKIKRIFNTKESLQSAIVAMASQSHSDR